MRFPGVEIHGSQDVSVFPMAFRAVKRPLNFYPKASMTYGLAEEGIEPPTCRL